MKLECDTFYFYNNGEYKTQSKWNLDFDRYHRDVHTCEDKEAIKRYTKHYKNKGLIINLI